MTAILTGKQYHQTYQDGKTITNISIIWISVLTVASASPLLVRARSSKSTLLHILGGLDVPTSGRFGYIGNASMI